MSPQPLHVRRGRGFTLIELMVGLALGMLLLLALVTLIGNVSRNNNEMARTNSVIENGRFSLQLLETDLSHAGFWGGWVPAFDDLAYPSAPGDSPAPSSTTAAPDPCLAYANWASTANYINQLIGIAVQAYEVPSTGTAPVCSSKLSNAKTMTAGSSSWPNDMLVVRHAAPCAASASATDTDCKLDASQLYFQVGRCGSSSSSVMTYTFAQSNTSTGTPTVSAFTQQNRGCNSAIVSPVPSTLTFGTGKDERPPVYKYVSNIYYIRDYSVSSGDGIPTLMRLRFSGTDFASAEALVEGVEGFRMELGIDNTSKSGATLTTANFASTVSWSDTSRLVTPTNRGDGNPDTYKRCTTSSACTAFELMNVVAVKLYVLVRANSKTPGYTDTRKYCLQSSCASTDYVGPFNDGYKRHVYTRTIRLTNISMRREVPPGS